VWLSSSNSAGSRYLFAEPQPRRDRHVELQRLAADALLFVGRHRAQRLHVVQAVGELDDDHPRVARHGDEQLLQVARLVAGFVAAGEAGEEVDVLDLRQAVHHVRHFDPEGGADLVQPDAGVLDRVVQQGGDDGVGVHVEVDADLGHFQRVQDVGAAVVARLALVRRQRQFVGLAQAVLVQVGVRQAQPVEQQVEEVVGLLVVTPGCGTHAAHAVAC
jgi:hypothetical protein